MQRLIFQVWYMYGFPMIWSKMIEYDNLNVVWCYDSCLKLFSYLFLFLKGLFGSFNFDLFLWPLMQNFTNQDSNCVYAMTTLWHKRWYQDMYQDDMVCMQRELWSLMCTSNVAGNTQRLVSIGKVRKMVYAVINAMARIYNDDISWYQDDMEVTVEVGCL